MLFDMKMSDADTIVLLNRSWWGAVPFPKFGIGCPGRRQATLFKKAGLNNVQILSSPFVTNFNVFLRPIYIVETLRDANKLRLMSDCHKINWIVGKPMANRR